MLTPPLTFSLSPLGILEPLRSLFCRWRNQPRFKDLFKVSQPRNGGRILGQEYGQGFSHGFHTFQGMLVFFIPFFPLSVAVFPSFLERHVLSRIRGRVPRDKLLSCWAYGSFSSSPPPSHSFWSYMALVLVSVVWLKDTRVSWSLPWDLWILNIEVTKLWTLSIWYNVNKGPPIWWWSLQKFLAGLEHKTWHCLCPSLAVPHLLCIMKWPKPTFACYCFFFSLSFVLLKYW